MQLDKTHVTVRARNLAEIGDLAFMLVRRYPQAILVGFLLGALPWMLLNTLLLGPIPWAESAENVYDEETIAQRWRYIWLMSSLVYLQTPIAGVFTTYFIGQAVFEQRPPWRRVVWDSIRIAPRWIWSLGLLRGPIVAMCLLALTWNQPFSFFTEVFVLGLLLLGVSFVRGFRPFMPEILLLERCPLRSDAQHPISAPRRSVLLHAPLSGDLFGRFVLSGCLLGLLSLSIFGSLVFFDQTLFSSQRWSLHTALILFPAGLWTAAGFSVLVRYLAYLDSRIRLEGWEVELGLRAEAIRQRDDELPRGPEPDPQTDRTGRRGPSRRAVETLCLLLGLLWGTPAIAQAAAAGASEEESFSEAFDAMGSLPWYDAESDQVEAVPVSPKLDDSVNRSSRWVAKPADANVASGSNATATGPTGTNTTWWGWFTGLFGRFGTLVGWLAVGLVFTLVVSLIVWAYWKMDNMATSTSGRSDGQSPELDRADQTRIENLPVDVRVPGGNLLAEADRLRAAGRLDDAVIYLFGHRLIQLDQVHAIRLARGKTNRQYLQELRGRPDLGNFMRTTVELFEQSYFGRYPLTAARFDELRNQQSDFDAAVRGLKDAA